MRLQADAARDEDREPNLRSPSRADLRRALTAHLGCVQAHNPDTLAALSQPVAINGVAASLSVSRRYAGGRGQREGKGESMTVLLHPRIKIRS
jgi:hypothetical protein